MTSLRMLNGIGSLLITIATVVHFVCISTPYLATVDLERFPDKVNEFIREKEEQDWTSKQIDCLHHATSRNCSISRGNLSQLHYGLWKVCAVGLSLSKCSTWEFSKLMFGLGVLQAPVSGWILCIVLLSTILAVGLSVLSLSGVPPSNQHFKSFPLITGTVALFLSFLILYGDVIFAVSYKSIWLSWCNFNGDQICSKQLDGLLKRQTTLTWGFYLDVMSAVFVMLACLLHLLSGKDLKYRFIPPLIPSKRT